MHKTRQFLPPLTPLTPGSYDLYFPRLRLAALPRGRSNVTDDFETLTRPILGTAIRNAGKALDIPQDHVMVPVHELQVTHILDKFKEATVYPEGSASSSRLRFAGERVPGSTLLGASRFSVAL